MSDRPLTPEEQRELLALVEELRALRRHPDYQAALALQHMAGELTRIRVILEVAFTEPAQDGAESGLLDEVLQRVKPMEDPEPVDEAEARAAKERREHLGLV